VLTDEEARPAPDDGESWVIAILREARREFDADAAMARYRAAVRRMETDPSYRACIDRIIAEVDAEIAAEAPRRCPDDAVCHHGCTRGCFRVACAGPLTGVYAGDDWPHSIWKQYQDTDGEL